MTHGSLFSGIGGFDLASDWMGWKNVFHCEMDSFCNKVLKYYWPTSISYEDITKTDFSIHRGTIDIISGGFPCQPFSQAGKRRGTSDTRYLWPEMLRVIREIRPKYVVGENVYGLVNWDGGLVFDTVCADLENEGFKVIPVVLPAAGVGAPHIRQRIFFIAYSDGNNDNREKRGGDEEKGGIQKVNREKNCTTGEFSRTSGYDNEGSDIDQHVAPSNGNDTRTNDDVRIDGKQQKKNKGRKKQSQSEFGKIGGDEYASDSERIGRTEKSDDDEHADETQQEERGQEQLGGASCPQDWWRSFPSVPAVCDGDDGLSDRLDNLTVSKWRKESIKSGGNAVVPQLVYTIFKTIEKFETLKN